jgi:8-oxo-dGTP pyrophosphatase MutT (NUDIX family)
MPTKKNTKASAKKSDWKREFSAGGVIYHRHDSKTHVLLIKDSYGRWSLPKGHIEKGETSEEAALRECSEETGIPLKDLKIVEKLGDIKYAYQLHGKRIFKVVIFFLIESSSTKLSHQWEVQDARWFSADEAYDAIEYKNTKAVMKKAVGLLRKEK